MGAEMHGSNNSNENDIDVIVDKFLHVFQQFHKQGNKPGATLLKSDLTVILILKCEE